MLIAAVAVVPSAATASEGHSARVAVSVKPSQGVSTTRFAVSFRAPDRSGHVGIFEHTYRLGVSGPAGNGCVSHMQLSPRAARGGQIVTVRLDPLKRGNPWCVGTFHGRVREISGPWCPPGAHACPKFPTRIATIGKFGFHVRRSGTDTAPPVFGGLRSATSCPAGPGSSAPFRLTWQAATDDKTPRGAIVYDVFMAAVSGHENFAKPDWKTSAGATQFLTPPVRTSAAHYFVVRARDLAGNVDRNRVERIGHVLPCV